METTTLIPQQEQTTEESAPALRPWTTPRLQRLDIPDETDAVVDPGSGFYIPPS